MDPERVYLIHGILMIIVERQCCIALHKDLKSYYVPNEILLLYVAIATVLNKIYDAYITQCVFNLRWRL